MGYMCQISVWSLWWGSHNSPTGPVCIQNDDCPHTHTHTHTHARARVAHEFWERSDNPGLNIKWKIMAIRLDFVTFTDIRRNTDKWRMSTQVDNISAVLIIQKWQMFISSVGKRFESNLLCYGNKLGLWYRHAFLFGMPNVGKSDVF